MALTNEQIEAVKDGELVRLAVSGVQCVVVRDDVFERVAKMFSPRETYPSVLKALDCYHENPEQYLEDLDE